MFSNTTQQKQLAQPYRKALLTALLVFTFFSAFLFAYINISRDNYVIAAVELAMAVYSVFLFFAIRHTQRLEFWVMAYIVPFLGVMMLVLVYPLTSLNAFIWVLLIPMVAHLLLGRRLGLGVSVIFIAISGGVFFSRYGGNPEVMQPVVISNISVMTLCILILSHVYEVTREQSEKRLVKLAHSDPLTGLPNRAHLQSMFEYEQSRHLRHGNPMSLVMLDLDFFKEVNDQHGHEVGDKTLQHVSTLLRTGLRKTDLAARLGGEEFCLLLADTNSTQAYAVAEKARIKIATTPLIINGAKIRLSISGGIAELGRDGNNLSDLTRCADEKLYNAKAEGRDRINR
jgi:diguanylate cyclase (GGDEF)-like protein